VCEQEIHTLGFSKKMVPGKRRASPQRDWDASTVSSEGESDWVADDNTMHVYTPSPPLPNNETWNTITRTLKRVRISRTSPGELRLKQDLNELGASPEWSVGMDEHDPLVCFLGSRDHPRLFKLCVAKFYPHVAPQVFRASNGEPIKLYVLDHWSAVLTVRDVLNELT
jgi:hypothetical protein